jgi:hypothetical protein
MTSSSRSNLCKLLTSAFPQLTARLSSMDVHVDVSLCKVIVTQLVIGRPVRAARSGMKIGVGRPQMPQ